MPNQLVTTSTRHKAHLHYHRAGSPRRHDSPCWKAICAAGCGCSS